MTADRSPWWNPRVHADRKPLLAARGRIAAGLRGYFAERDFTEVEAAILQVSPGNEAHLHAFATDLKTPAGGTERRYLHTSPEFACKKLLAAGERQIFDFARVFRNRERGALHHPEFTLLEWYRAEAPYEAVMADCLRVLALSAQTVEGHPFTYRGRTCDPFATPERLTVAEAFSRYADIDVLASVAGRETEREGFAAAASNAGIRVAADDTWSDIFSKVLVERIEPNLGLGRA